MKFAPSHYLGNRALTRPEYIHERVIFRQHTLMQNTRHENAVFLPPERKRHCAPFQAIQAGRIQPQVGLAPGLPASNFAQALKAADVTLSLRCAQV